jgi:NitT/TauT family transport system substrate-binding protein
VASLEDGLYVLESKLKDPAFVARMGKFLKATFKGWNDAVKDPAGAAKIVVAADTSGSATEGAKAPDGKRGQADHQPPAPPRWATWSRPPMSARSRCCWQGGESPVIKKDPGKAAYSHAVWEAASWSPPESFRLTLIQKPPSRPTSGPR